MFPANTCYVGCAIFLDFNINIPSYRSQPNHVKSGVNKLDRGFNDLGKRRTGSDLNNVKAPLTTVFFGRILSKAHAVRLLLELLLRSKNKY